MAIVLFTTIFWIKPKSNNGLNWMIITFVFVAAGWISHSYLLFGAAALSLIVALCLLRLHYVQNRKLEVIFVSDHDDHYLHHFLDYYHSDIRKYFPAFDFKIEDEYLVALILSEMETVGLIIAEIKNAETLRICVDYLVPKYRRSLLARKFHQCQLHYVDFLGYRYLYTEPQSKAHNQYLERVGFRLIDGKYIHRCS